MSVAGGNRRKGNRPLDCQTFPCCTWAPSPTGSAPSPLFEASNCRAKGREKLGMWNRGSPQKELPHFFLGLGTWAGCNGQCFVHLRAPMPQYSKYCTSFHPNAHFFGLSVSPVCLRDSRTGPPTAHALSRCHYG